jgi:hypothetical protein
MDLPLEFMEYNGMLLTNAEIALLQMVEKRLFEKKRLQDEKRADREHLKRSLNSTIITGIQKVFYLIYHLVANY